MSVATSIVPVLHDDNGATVGHEVSQPRFWRTLRTPALASLLIQLAIAPFTSLPGDVAVWWQTSERAMAGLGLYRLPGFSYPPLYGYWCLFLGGAAHVFGMHPSALGGPDPSLFAGAGSGGAVIVTTPLFTLLLKAPMIIADLATGYYVWRIALHLCRHGRSANRRARAAFCWWALNPLVIVESAVHGQIDALAACAIAAAVFYVLDDRWGLAGVALALGVAAKISPVFLIAPAAGFAIASAENRWRHLRSLVVGGLAAGAVVIGPVLSASFVKDVFTRVGVGASVGGLGLTGLLSLPSLRTLELWLTGRDAALGQLCDAATIAVSLGAGAWCARTRSKTSFVKACLVTVAASLLLSPVLNPQYLLWVVPLLALGAGGVLGGRTGWYRSSLAALAVGGTSYLIAMVGWADLLAPASAAFGWPPAHAVISSRAALAGRGGPSWLPPNLGTKLALACTGAVLIGVGTATTGLVTGRKRASWSRAATPTRVLAPRGWRTLALCGASIIGIEAFGMTAPLLSAPPAIAAVISQGRPGTVKVTVSMRGGQPIRLAAFAVAATPAVTHILVYWAPTRPDSGAESSTVLGTIQSLEALFGRFPIMQVDARSLARVMSRTGTAPGTLLLDVAGTLPNTVWGRAHPELLTTWIRSGGTLAFAGDIPGFYAVPPGPLTVTHDGRAVLAPGVQALGRSGLLPLGVVRGRVAWNAPPGLRASRWAGALGLVYSDLAIPISRAAVVAHGGTVLGLLGRQGDTSEAFLPVGKGGILDFAGSDEAGPVAYDVARLVLSGWFNHIGSAVATASGTSNRVLEIPLPRGAVGVDVVAFSANPQAVWTWSKTLAWHRL